MPLLRSLSGRRVTAATIGCLAPLVVASIPLLDGLTYEYAFLVGLLLFACSIASGSQAARTLESPFALRFKLLVETPAARLFRVLGDRGIDLVTAATAATIVPAALGAKAGCAWENGLPIYLLVVLPTAPLGLAVGAFARTVATARRVARGALIAGLVAVSVALTVYEVLAGPRAVFHNLVVGIISNTGYLGFDESIRIESHDYLHRVATLLVAALLFWLAAARTAIVGVVAAADDTTRGRWLLAHERRRAVRWATALAVALGAMATIGDPCGFGSGRRSVRRVLSTRYDSAHLRLYFRPGSDVEIARHSIADDGDWAVERLCEQLGLDPTSIGPVTVYVYADDAEQRQLTGASGYLFAKPWLLELHTRLGARGELVALRHELVHVLAARFGLPVARVSTSYGLIEGLAEGVAGNFGDRPWRHRAVVAALEVGLLPPARELFANLGFANRDAATSYLATASFCGFLLARSGPERLREVYARAAFERVYGANLDQLDAEWRTWLRAIPIDPRDRAIAARVFDREVSPPFFRRHCARLGRRSVDPTTCIDDATARQLELSRLDTAAALGPLLNRDAALATLARVAAEVGDVDGAERALRRRDRLGIAPAVVRGGIHAVDQSPALRHAILYLLTGHAKVLEHDLAGSLSSGEVATAFLHLAMAVERRPTPQIVDAVAIVGGCAPGLEEIEGQLLLRAARTLSRRAERAAALRALEAALAIAPSQTDALVDALDELDRLRSTSRSARAASGLTPRADLAIVISP